eukprot:725748-Pleurochrysis_carterae.AAC.3
MERIAGAEASRICADIFAQERFMRDLKDARVKGNLAWSDVHSERSKSEVVLSDRCLSDPVSSADIYEQRVREICRRRASNA